MAEIVKITKDGVIQYPITKPEAVIDENGKNVLQLIRENGGGGGGSYDDTGIKKDISALKANDVQQDTKLAKLSEEVGKKQNTITDLETIRSGAAKGATAIQEVKTINGQSIVGSGNIEIQGGGGASNEWKCIADRRLLEGEKNIIFTTYADGTPLKATELMVQILNDKTAAERITGYVGIKSTNNQNEAIYGSLEYESVASAENNHTLRYLRFVASPIFFAFVEMCDGIKSTVATHVNMFAQGGNLKAFQIYEDIVYVKIMANSPLTSAAPYIKVYAR